MEQNLTANNEYGSTSDKSSPTAASSSGEKVGAGSIRTRCMYGLFLLLGFGLCLLFRVHVMEFITKWQIIHDTDCTSTECIANQSAYRISFALWIFFFIHMLLSSNCNLCMKPSQKINFNKGGFLFRVIALIPLLILAFVIPNAFFVFYAWFSVVLSVLFLLAQLIILLDFSYNWSESWASQEETRYQIGLFVCAGLLYVGGLTFIGLLYHWYGYESSCKTGQGMISVTLIAMILYTFLSIVTAHGSIIPSGTVFVYTVWSTYSALASGFQNQTECNKLAATDTTQLVIAIIFCGISLAYTCINAANSRSSFQLSSGDDEEPVDAESQEASNFTFFHGIMMLGACYMAMLVTGWDISGSNGTGMAGVDGGATPMWVKFGTEIVCILLYIWTLIAPKVCGDREFDMA